MRKLMAGLVVLLMASSAMAAIEIEAEAAKRNTFTKIQTGSGVSGGKYVVLGSKRGRVNKPDEANPELTFAFDVESAGSFSAVGRILAPSGGSNSFYVAMDDTGVKSMSVKADEAWQDKSFGTWQLDAGPHVLRVWTRESGMGVDRVIIGKQILPKSVINKYPDPPIKPPANEHPRVLVRKGDLDMIRARRTQGENADAWTRVQKLAAMDSKKLSAKLPVVSSASFRGAALDATRAKAFMYLTEGDEKTGRDAVWLADTLLNKQHFKHGRGVTRPIGELIYSAALVYDWCYPLMQDKQREEFINHFERLASQMEIRYPPYNQGAITGHAGEAQLLRDILAASIAVYDEYPAMYRMAAGRFFAEFIEPRNWFYPSGRHHQGDAYGPYRYGWEVFSAWHFRRMAGVDVYDKTQVRVPYAWFYSRRPDGPLFRVGDSGHGSGYTKFQYPLLLAANYYGDPILKGEMMEQGVASVIRSEPVLFLLINDPGLEAKAHDDMPLTRNMGGPLPSMQIRTGWNIGLASNSVIVDLWGAHTHFNNHDHLDAGSFQIYYRGALAHDPGVYGGGSYGCDYDWAYNKRTISHNAMLVYDPDEDCGTKGNDGGQRLPNGGSEPATFKIINTPEHRNGQMVASGFGPNDQAPLYDYMQVDLAQGYSKKVEAYTRTFVFLNLDRPANPGALIVLDRIQSAKPEFKKYWLIHTPEKPTTGDASIDIRRTDGMYSGRLYVSALLPKKPKMEIVGGIGQEVDVMGKRYELPMPKAEAPGWRVQISPATSEKRDTFLNVLQILDAEGADLLPVTQTESDACFAVAIADRLVLLPKTDEALAGSFSFRVPTAAQVLATGLKASDWEIAPKGGSAKWHTTVSADAGTAFLMLEAGEYEMRPGSGGGAAPSHSEMRPKAETELQAVAIVDGTTVPMGAKIERVDGVAQIPLGRIAKAGGASVDMKGNTLKARFGDNELTARAGEKSFRVNDVVIDTEGAIVKRDGDFYGPPEAISQLLRMRFQDFPAMDEIGFYKPVAEERPALWIVKTRATGAESLNPPLLAQDGDFGSVWSSNADRVDYEMDLGTPQTVGCVSVAWYHGKDRQEFFSIEVSDDGKQWHSVWSGKSSGKSEVYEDYTFDPVKTRHVRLVCRGNSTSKWNSIRELRVREK